MNRAGYVIATLCMVVSHMTVLAQRDEPVRLNREKLKNIREEIRYENGSGSGMGRAWTYEPDEYRRANSDRASGEGWAKDYRRMPYSRSGRGGSSDYEREEFKEKEQEEWVEPDTDSSSSGWNLNMGSGLANVLLIVLIAGLVALIVWAIIKNGRKEESKVKVTADDLDEDRDPTEVPVSELELALREALANKDYRKAVRIYFIFILKYLGHRQLIQWDKDKTNQDYMNELLTNHSQFFRPFSKASMVYEFVWYGKHDLSEDQFNEARPDLQKFVDEIEVR